MNEEWIKGTFSDEKEKEYVGILHIHKDIRDSLKDGPSVRFADFATEWLEVYMKQRLASTTYENYRQQLRKHILPAFGDRDITTIETVDIQYFYNERKHLKKET